MRQFVMIQSIVMGLLLIGMSIPLIMRKIPPNWIYGVKLPKTVNNPEIWYPANEYGGKWLTAAGAAITLAALTLSMLRMSDNAYAMSMFWVTMVSLGIAAIAILIYVHKL